MKRALTFIIILLLTPKIYSKENSAWLASEFSDTTILLHALHVFREDSKKGATPTFMVNKNIAGDCHISLGLAMPKKYISEQPSNIKIKEGLKEFMDNSEFLTDGNTMVSTDTQTQVLDMGGFLYSRKIISAGQLAEFMFAKYGTIRMRDVDAELNFSMYGFKEMMDVILDSYCN